MTSPSHRLRWTSIAASLALLAASFGASCAGPGPEADIGEAVTGADALLDAPSAAEIQDLLVRGDVERAAPLAEALVEADPESALAWSLLARACFRLDDLDGAVYAYGRALALEPTRREAVYGLARVAAARGETDDAFERLLALRDEGSYDLSQVDLDEAFTALRDDARWRRLALRRDELEPPVVEDDARVLASWTGEAAGDELGWIARRLGDVDGDGVSEFVTSAPSYGQSAGKIYVMSPAGGDTLWSARGDRPGDRLGIGVEAAGDVDGDGIGDVVASAPGGGWARIYAGRDGRVLRTLRSEDGDEDFGRHVDGVGDVDGDGRADVLVGVPKAARDGEARGRAAVYSGADGSKVVEWWGEAAGDRFGEAVGGEGGVVLVGAPDAGDGDRGRVYVYRAVDGRLPAEPDLAIDSDGQGVELGGMFLSVVGDVDGDGTADLYASDWKHAARGPRTGKIVVHSGADGRELLARTGDAAGDGFGIGPADAGDVDGDGRDDLIVGAWRESSAAPSGGKVYLLSGADASVLRTWTGRTMGDTLGFDATRLGDVDGDGRDDFLVTAAWSAAGGPKSGRVFVFGG